MCDTQPSQTGNNEFDLNAVSHLSVRIINVHLEGPEDHGASCALRMTDGRARRARVGAGAGGGCDATVFSVNN